MLSKIKVFIPILVVLLSCKTNKLKVLCKLPKSLIETSAAETTINPNIIWTIEDSGNKNNLYAVNKKGVILKDIKINNAQNIDWEDLTSDVNGNIYIGDFGNNRGTRSSFTIYKTPHPDSIKNNVEAELISFKLPAELKGKNFEAFFLRNDYFYLFSKNTKTCTVVKVPNKIGLQNAKIITTYNFNEKGNKITAADISADGKTIILLNHDKLWKLRDFTSDNFFSGTITAKNFNHKSQKEGLCFKDNTTVYITDEKNKNKDNTLYTFSL